MIIVSITGPSMREALQQVRFSAKYADMVEFRLDLISIPNLVALFSSTRKEIIATCRPRWEGGEFGGTELEKLELLTRASRLGASYVDLELKSGRKVFEQFQKGKCKIVASLHAKKNERVDPTQVCKQLIATGADVIKFAYTAADSHEMSKAIEFLECARTSRTKAIAIAMGEFGEPSRILYKKFGGWATYASPGIGRSAASGQVHAKDLKHLYLADRVNRNTRVFGVIGFPVSQSKGIFVHNAMFRQAKKNAVYCRFPVRNVEKFMVHIAPHMNGFSVTAPHKQTVLPFLDTIDSKVKSIGATNTVFRVGGKWHGTNTDASGALDAIERVSKVKGKQILVIGAGGAARAIVYEVLRRGGDVLIANRTWARSRKLANDFDCRHVSMAQVLQTNFDILVNATSVGMVPDANRSCVPKRLLNKKIVFDAVYNPLITKLLRDAKSVGAKTISGVEMYVNQAEEQSKIFAGRRPKTGAVKAIVMKHL